jgi:hypothetical protein
LGTERSGENAAGLSSGKMKRAFGPQNAGLLSSDWTIVNRRILSVIQNYYQCDETCRVCSRMVQSWLWSGSGLVVTFGRSRRTVSEEFTRVVNSFAKEALHQMLCFGFFAWVIPKDWRLMNVLHPSLGTFYVRRSIKRGTKMRFELYDPEKEKRGRGRIGVAVLRPPEPDGSPNSVMSGLIGICSDIQNMMNCDATAMAELCRPPLVVSSARGGRPEDASPLSILSAAAVESRAERERRAEMASGSVKKDLAKTSGDATVAGKDTTAYTTFSSNPFARLMAPAASSEMRGCFKGNVHDIFDRTTQSYHLPHRDSRLLEWLEYKQSMIAAAFGIAPSAIRPSSRASYKPDSSAMMEVQHTSMKDLAQDVAACIERLLNDAFRDSDGRELTMMALSQKNERRAAAAAADVRLKRRYSVDLPIKPRADAQTLIAMSNRGHLHPEDERTLLFRLIGLDEEFGHGPPEYPPNWPHPAPSFFGRSPTGAAPASTAGIAAEPEETAAQRAKQRPPGEPEKTPTEEEDKKKKKKNSKKKRIRSEGPVGAS